MLVSLLDINSENYNFDLPSAKGPPLGLGWFFVTLGEYRALRKEGPVPPAPGPGSWEVEKC